MSKDPSKPSTERMGAKSAELSSLFDIFSVLCGCELRPPTSPTESRAPRQKRPRRSLRVRTGGAA